MVNRLTGHAKWAWQAVLVIQWQPVQFSIHSLFSKPLGSFSGYIETVSEMSNAEITSQVDRSRTLSMAAEGKLKKAVGSALPLVCNFAQIQSNPFCSVKANIAVKAAQGANDHSSGSEWPTQERYGPNAGRNDGVQSSREL